jgi:hypothetical protein
MNADLKQGQTKFLLVLIRVYPRSSAADLIYGKS